MRGRLYGATAVLAMLVLVSAMVPALTASAVEVRHYVGTYQQGDRKVDYNVEVTLDGSSATGTGDITVWKLMPDGTWVPVFDGKLQFTAKLSGECLKNIRGTVTGDDRVISFFVRGPVQLPPALP